jgi:naphthoate synthase/2-ketocyclohexanecarboxyl-CoA hydrolase
MWMLCRRYTAHEAREMGLVNKVVPLERLEAEVDAWCGELLLASPGCLEVLKAAFDQEMDGYADLGVISSRLYPDWFDTPEGKEGGAAFTEKRKPRFWQLREREQRMRQALIDEYDEKK